MFANCVCYWGERVSRVKKVFNGILDKRVRIYIFVTAVKRSIFSVQLANSLLEEQSTEESPPEHPNL